MTALTIHRAEPKDGWIALTVEGEVDLATVADLESAVEEVLDGQTANLVIDLNPTSFMDSTGLRALVEADRGFKAAGRSFAIAVASGPVARLIDLSGIDQQLTVVTHPDEVR